MKIGLNGDCVWNAKMWKGWILSYLWLLCGNGWVSTPVFASGSSVSLCAAMQKQGYYQAAADCYGKEADKIPTSSAMSEQQRLLKGALLREASRNLDKQASQTKHMDHAAYLREQALLLLERIVQEELVRKVQGKRRGRLIRTMASQIRAKIQYTPLGVTTDDDKAKISIRGFRFETTAYRQFNRSLRPGTYTIYAHFPGESQPRERRVLLSPQQPVLQTFLRRPGLPPMVWVGYVVGGAALVAGVAVLAAGILHAQHTAACVADGSCKFVGTTICPASDTRPECQGVPTNAFGEEKNQQYASLLAGTGGGVLAVGVGLLIAGGVIHARATQKQYQQRIQRLTHRTRFVHPGQAISSPSFTIVFQP